jgi:hypothetical protein
MSSRLVGLALVVVLAACPKRGPELVAAPPGEAPLDRALALMERERASLALPQADEARYTLPTSYGVIDAVLAEPLSLPSLGAALGLALDAADEPRAIFDALSTLSPAVDGESAEAEPVGSRHIAGLPLPSELIASPRWAVRTQHLPAPWPEAIGELALLIETLDAASSSWDRRGAGPTRPDRAAEEFFIDAETGQYRFMTHPVGVQFEFLEHARSLDVGAMEHAALELLEAARAWQPRLDAVADQLAVSDGPLLQVDTALGRIVVGSSGRDTYGSAILAIDPGGDDNWVANAGGNAGMPSRAALALDLGGNDTYDSPDPHAQGAGFLGVGVLVDLGEGADRYSGPSHCQGAGFMGVGVLWDGGGDDRYTAEGFAQGAGTLGVGLLVDVSGNDQFAAGSRAQGFGSTGGLGALVDLGGADQRRVGLPGIDVFGPAGGGGQGAGFGTRPLPWDRDVALHGGVGLLYDRAGDDVYFGRGFAQGAAWFESLGLLLERGGNDRYTGEVNCQGAAVHLSAALAQDMAGLDTWSGTRRVQASATDRAVAILDDRGPEADGYRIGPTGPASASGWFSGQALVRNSHALAILVDAGGDDIHQVVGDALAVGVPAARSGRDGLAILLDLGGTDAYEAKGSTEGTNPSEGATWFSGLVGIGMDLDMAADGFIPEPGWSPWRAPSQAGFTWSGSREPTTWTTQEAGSPEGDPAARWTWARAMFETWLEDQPAPDSDVLVPMVELARADRDPRVQRQAGLALLAAGDPRGIDAIVTSLPFRAGDNDPSTPAGSIVGTLQAVTGVEIEIDPRAWRLWWNEHRDGFDAKTRLPPWQLLERARLAGERGDLERLGEMCDQAADSAAGNRILLDRLGALTGAWARVLVTPESHRSHNPPLAAELARRAVRWSPDAGARDWVTLTSALLQLSEIDLARRAIEKATLADPDGLRVNALRHQMGLDLGSAPEPSP